MLIDWRYSVNGSLWDFFHSPVFWSAFLAWLVAQCAKMICNLALTHRLDFQYLVSLGGMPSAHSAMVSSLATALGLQCGWGSPVFALSFGFAALTMFDASTVRRAAGQQARVLNGIVDELFKQHTFPDKKLMELIGHTRLEVFMGMAVGILVAMLIYAVPILM